MKYVYLPKVPKEMEKAHDRGRSMPVAEILLICRKAFPDGSSEILIFIAGWRRIKSTPGYFLCLGRYPSIKEFLRT